MWFRRRFFPVFYWCLVLIAVTVTFFLFVFIAAAVFRSVWWRLREELLWWEFKLIKNITRRFARIGQWTILAGYAVIISRNDYRYRTWKLDYREKSERNGKHTFARFGFFLTRLAAMRRIWLLASQFCIKCDRVKNTDRCFRHTCSIIAAGALITFNVSRQKILIACKDLGSALAAVENYPLVP